MSAIAPADTAPGSAGGQSFLLERVQPALSGLMDGSLSTLAPIFAVALATHRPLTASILAWLRHKFFHTSFARSFLAITVGGAIIAALSAALGIAAGG